MIEKTLLHIDDREMNRSSIKWNFDSFPDEQRLGNIVSAATGEEGLDLITPDTHIVLSDYDLGAGIDGLAVLKWVKENRPDIFRVLHTTYVTDPEFEERANA